MEVSPNCTEINHYSADPTNYWVPNGPTSKLAEKTSILPWCVHIIEITLWGPNASSWKLKGETVYITHNHKQEANGIYLPDYLWLWGSRHPISSHIFVLFLHQGRPYLAKKKGKRKEREGAIYSSHKSREMTDEGRETPKIFPQVLNLRRTSLYCSLWCIVFISQLALITIGFSITFIL